MTAVVGAVRAELSASVAKFAKDMESAGASVDKFARRAKRIGDNLQSVGTKMSVGITAPLALLGKSSIDAFQDFEKGISNVSTLVDTAAESMGDMSKAVIEIGKRTPVALGDLTKALYDIRSAGIDASGALGVLENSARLGVAGLGSTAEAADLVTSAINAFSLEGEEMAGVYDLIFKAVEQGKTTISELSQGFGRTAGAVAEAGVSLDEFLAGAAALTGTGQKAAESFTQIQAAISGLTRENKVFDEFLRKKLNAGSLKELIKQSGGLVEAFKRIVEAADGNSNALLKAVGSVEGYNAIVQLTGGLSDNFAQSLERMRDGANAVDDAFKKQNDTLDAYRQRTENAATAAKISIGETLLPIFEKLVGMLGTVAEKFTSLDPSTQSMIVAMGAVAAAIGPVLIIFGTFAKAIGAIAPLLLVLGKGIATLIAASGPIGLLIIAITTVVTVWQNWDKIAVIVEKMVTAIQKWLGEKLLGVLDAVGERVEKVTGFFKDMYEKVVGKSYVPDMVDAVAHEFGRMEDIMVQSSGRATAQVADDMKEARDEMSLYADQAARNIQSIFSAYLYNPFEKGLEGMVLQFGDALRKMAAEFLASKLLELLKGSFGGQKSGGSGLLGLFTQAAGAFGGFRAMGGPVLAGTPYIVGERGPELFVPMTSGNIEPRVPGGDITVNMIESPDRGGEVRRRNTGGRQEIDVFVSDIRGDGPRSRAMQETFGLARRGL